MIIEKININEIKEYKNNSKKHTDNQIDKIKDSIINFGYNDPIAIDENNEIIEGHGRLMALKQITNYSNKEIDVIRLSNLSEPQKKAYRIAHNKLNMITDFDLDVLKQEFYNLEDTDFFDATGFDNQEISEIWEKQGEIELIGSKKETEFEHTCPECGHTWENINKKERSNIN